jgi:glucan phosphoethanolaminetransferase (alkaline phosphatase superfamily)
MSTLLGMLGAFAIYWIVLFATCYIVVEYGQSYLYDEATPAVGLKVLLGSGLLAMMLTWTRSEFYTMFTSELRWTVLLAIVAFGVFVLIFRFQPWHALPIGLITVLLISGTATMAVNSFADRDRPLPGASRGPSKPLRRATPITAPEALPEGPKEAKK